MINKNRTREDCKREMQKSYEELWKSIDEAKEKYRLMQEAGTALKLVTGPWGHTDDSLDEWLRDQNIGYTIGGQ